MSSDSEFESRYDNHDVQLIFGLSLLKCSYFQQDDTCISILVSEIVCSNCVAGMLAGCFKFKNSCLRYSSSRVLTYC